MVQTKQSNQRWWQQQQQRPATATSSSSTVVAVAAHQATIVGRVVLVGLALRPRHPITTNECYYGIRNAGRKLDWSVPTGGTNFIRTRNVESKEYNDGCYVVPIILYLPGPCHNPHGGVSKLGRPEGIEYTPTVYNPPYCCYRPTIPVSNISFTGGY